LSGKLCLRMFSELRGKTSTFEASPLISCRRTNLLLLLIWREVYLNEFVQLAQTTNPDKSAAAPTSSPSWYSLRFSPPMTVTGPAGESPFSQKVVGTEGRTVGSTQ
jgi:hypothetical protein